MSRIWAVAMLLAIIASAHAGKADIVDVVVGAGSGGTFRFDVTVRHADEGWEHYADSWQVVSPDGKILGTRVLHHPHVNEQPFTRSLSGVEIPAGIDQVILRAGDSVHGFGGREIPVALPGR